MNTSCSPLARELPPCATLSVADDTAQPYIYSFRCSRGMDASLSRLMNERGLNRTSVIRLALYSLDCFCRRQEVKDLSLHELVESLEGMAAEDSLSFAEFIRGK